MFGEIAVLCQGRRTTALRAKTAVKIASKVFLDLAPYSPEIGMQVMTVLAQRLERTTALLQRHGRR